MMANTDFVSLFPDPDSPGFDHEKDLREGVGEEDLRWTRRMFGEKFHPSVGNPERLDRRGLQKLLPEADRPKLTVSVRDGEEDGEEEEEEEEEEKNGNGNEEEKRARGHGEERREEVRGGTTKRITKPRVVVIGHDWDVFADQNEKVSFPFPTQSLPNTPSSQVTFANQVFSHYHTPPPSHPQGPMSIPKAVINGYMNPAWQRYNEGLARLASDRGDKNDEENVVPVKIAKDCGHFIQKDDPELVARELDLLLRDLGL